MSVHASIQIINNSGKDLSLYHQHSYQLKHWKFPEIIKPNEDTIIEFAFSNKLLKNAHDDKGEAFYQTDSGDKFEVRVFVERKWEPLPTGYACFEFKNLQGNLKLSKEGKHMFGNGAILIVSLK